MSMFRAFQYRIYPNNEQRDFLIQQFGACRYVWNHFLDLRNKRYIETGKGMTYKEMSSLLTEMKKKEEWLNSVNSQSLQQTLMHLDTAFKRFFKKEAMYPSFKRKRCRQSFTVPQHFSLSDGKVMLPKIAKPIRIFMHRKAIGIPRSVTVSMTPSGKYYASILTEVEPEQIEKVPVSADTTVGIDVGINEFLTTSDGLQIHNPKKLRSSEKKLIKYQRRLSRKVKDSQNREKARIKVASIHEHIANQRKDFLSKVSDVLTRQYDTVAIEDLNINGMKKNHHLARSISDAGWHSFFAMLKAKALQRGKNVIEIGVFEPSSKMCSKCGHTYDLKLDERSWKCPECGMEHERDLNAARNIKRFGLVKVGVPTDGGEFTPVDRCVNTLSLFTREGIVQTHWLKQEAHML